MISFTKNVIIIGSLTFIILSSIAGQLTEKQIEVLKAEISSFDKDGDGTINIEEFGQIIKSIDKTLPKYVVKEIFNKVDTDGSGTIDIDELTMMAKQNDNDLRETFQLFVKDGNDYINAADLPKVLNELKENKTDEEVDEMINTYDANGDGQFSYEEFVKMMNNMNV